MRALVAEIVSERDVDLVVAHMNNTLDKMATPQEIYEAFLSFEKRALKDTKGMENVVANVRAVIEVARYDILFERFGDMVFSAVRPASNLFLYPLVQPRQS